MGFLCRVWICIAVFACVLYGIIDRQNMLTELRREIPILMKQVKAVEQENTRLQYEVDRFESPMNLIDLARKPEYGHLRHPYTEDIVFFSRLGGLPAAAPPPLGETSSE